MKSVTALCSLLSLLFVGSLSFAADVVSVVDDQNRPVANATVLLGFEAGNPFPNNTLTTDTTGTAAVPADWKAALPVTVQAPGFITTTIPVAMPGMMTIQLTPQESPTEIEVKGNTSGFGTMVDNGKVQFGLVIPAINRAQMLAFDMSTVMSPQTDTINVLGQKIDIPSNLTLPDQTVTYIFPVHLNKPDYRTYLRSQGEYLMTATHGSFPLNKVVGDIKAGKSIFEMINYLTFAEGGQKDIQVTGNMAGQDLTVNQTQFNGSVSVTAPTFASNQVMVTLALAEQANGLMLPTDLKRLTPGQNMALKSTGSAPSVLSLLLVDSKKVAARVMEAALDMLSPMALSKPGGALPDDNLHLFTAQSFQQLSFALLPAKAGVAPKFMDLIASPTLDAQNVLKMAAPALPAGLKPVATYMVLTEIQTFGSGSVQSEQRTRLWEVWSGAWLNQVELPHISFPRNPSRKYRWEVMFLAQPVSFTSGGPGVNGVDLHSVTHVTRNTLEL